MFGDWHRWADEHREHLFLSGVVFLAAALRLISLGKEPLWLDEATTYFVATKPVGEILGIMSAGEFNPPLFYLLEHVLLIFGHSEWVLRLIPCLTGIAVVPVIYQISRQIGTITTARASALVASLSPGLIFYSQEARAYMPAVLMVALATYLFLKVQTDPRTIHQVGLGLTAALAFWMHFWAVLPVGILLLHDLLTRKQILPMALFGGASLPIFYTLSSLIQLRTGIGATFGYRGITIIHPTLTQFFSGGWSLLFFLLLAGIGLYFLARKHPTMAFTCSTLILLPCIITIFASPWIPMMPRYLLYLSVPLIAGIGQVLDRIPPGWWAAGLMLFLILILIPPLVGYYTSPQKDNWPGVACAVANLTQGQENIVLLPGYNIHPFSYYYHADVDGTTIHTPSNLSELEGIPPNFCQSCRKRPTDYYVVTPDIFSIPEGQEMAQWVDSHASLKAQFGNILIFERNV